MGATRCSGTNCGCEGKLKRKPHKSKDTSIEIKKRAIQDLPNYKALLYAKDCILQVCDDDKDET